MQRHPTSAMAHLEMVDSPMSNAQAAFIELNNMGAEVSHLKQSDFYMLTARPPAHFENYVHDEKTCTIRFDICMGAVRDSGSLNYLAEPALDAFEGKFTLTARADHFSFDDSTTGENITVYTPDSLLWWKSRNRAGILGFERARELSTYDLLYVGIAKEGDSYSRLIERGHKQRGLILSNEQLRGAGPRVADETYIFFFRVDPMVFRSMDPNVEIEDEDLDMSIQEKRYVADAEKAFIKLLDPTYNRAKYPNYPKGTDGLYGEGLQRYGYALAEEMILNTPTEQICGARAPWGGLPWSNRADSIFIEGEVVQLLKAGIDFPDDEPI